MSDLWPQDFGTTTAPTPVSILKEQASLLGQKTKNIVKGAVKRTSVGWDDDRREAMFRNFAPVSAPTKVFNYTFYLEGPVLDNYTYRLFRISFDVDLYPVRFFIDEGMADELSISPKDGVSAKDEEEFKAILSRILGSDRTRKVVTAILSQSTDLETGNERRA